MVGVVAVVLVSVEVQTGLPDAVEDDEEEEDDEDEEAVEELLALDEVVLEVEGLPPPPPQAARLATPRAEPARTPPIRVRRSSPLFPAMVPPVTKGEAGRAVR